jgi:hypothetical protein
MMSASARSRVIAAMALSKSSVKVRQAALAALDMAPILQAALGDPQFCRLDSSLSFQEES